MRDSFVALLVLLWALILAGCSDSSAPAAAAVTGGDPGRGSAAIFRHGCAHAILSKAFQMLAAWWVFPYRGFAIATL